MVELRATRPPADLGEQVLLRFVGVKVTTRAKQVVITRVVPGSRADEAGLAAGDVVLQVNGERIGNVEDVNRIVGREHTRSSVMLVVGRGPFAYQLPFSMSP